MPATATISKCNVLLRCLGTDSLCAEKLSDAFCISIKARIRFGSHHRPTPNNRIVNCQFVVVESAHFSSRIAAPDYICP